MKRLLISMVGLLIVTSAALAVDPERTRRIGEESAVKTETPHPVPRAAAGTPAWRDVFHWKDASYIAVHFEKFDLAPGERVVVRTPDGRYAYSFEGEGKPGSGGTFWATHVPGRRLRGDLLRQRRGRRDGATSSTSSRTAIPTRSTGSGRRAAMPETDLRTRTTANGPSATSRPSPRSIEKSRAIARLVINGVFGCTGWLVGCEGHLMTNAHCITNPADAMNTDYEFMAEGATCETSCASLGGLPGDHRGQQRHADQDGHPGRSRLLARAAADQPLGRSTGSSGSAAPGPVIGERIYLNGHPAGWGKQFQVPSDDATDESGFCEIHVLDEPSGARLLGGRSPRGRLHVRHAERLLRLARRRLQRPQGRHPAPLQRLSEHRRPDPGRHRRPRAPTCRTAPSASSTARSSWTRRPTAAPRS